MLSLSEAQGNFIDTINDGPDTLHPELFAGPPDRVLLGLKAHANTISHARLVALEKTFPLTQQEMGAATFNNLSRAYVETGEARAADANGLGCDFARFLRLHAVDRPIVDLANIEWAWLQSYHAAEATPLAMADLSSVREAALLEMPVTLHPSGHFVPVAAPLASALDELAGQQPVAVLVIRPEADVRLLPLDYRLWVLLLLAAQENCTLGNLIAHTFEHAGEQAPLKQIIHLIGAGALVKAG